jgi:hypothetical protein
LGRINNRSATDVELLTVPLSETIIVPVTVTNNRPADMVLPELQVKLKANSSASFHGHAAAPHAVPHAANIAVRKTGISNGYPNT